MTAKGYEGHNRNGSPESKLLGGGKVLDNKAGIRRLNPITYIDKNDPPFLIIHGGKDPIVPLNQSEALHKALRQAEVESKLHVIQAAGHGGKEFREPVTRKMQTDFVIRALGK